MKPSPTDTDALPHRWPNLAPLTGLTFVQAGTVCALARQRMGARAGRSRGLPLPVRVLLVLIHLPTNPTTPALAALFNTSQAGADPIIHHLVPLLASTPRPKADTSNYPWIIDATPIPLHDPSKTAISRRSINTQIIICSHRRRVLGAGRGWPGKRNDVVAARHTLAHLLDGRVVLGDGGYRGIPTTTSPQRDNTGRAPSTTNNGAPTGASEPVPNSSSPGSKTGKYCPNAPPRPRDQPQPPDRGRTVEPQDAITGHAY
jgi:Transposase DDE domain